MESSASGLEAANAGIEGTADPCSSAGSDYRLSVHQIVGGGKGTTTTLLLPNSQLLLSSA